MPTEKKKGKTSCLHCALVEAFERWSADRMAEGTRPPLSDRQLTQIGVMVGQFVAQACLTPTTGSRDPNEEDAKRSFRLMQTISRVASSGFVDGMVGALGGVEEYERIQELVDLEHSMAHGDTPLSGLEMKFMQVDGGGMREVAAADLPQALKDALRAAGAPIPSDEELAMGEPPTQTRN